MTLRTTYPYSRKTYRCFHPSRLTYVNWPDLSRNNTNHHYLVISVWRVELTDKYYPQTIAGHSSGRGNCNKKNLNLKIVTSMDINQFLPLRHNPNLNQV